MRIRTKLLLTYLVLIGFVAITVGWGLPRFVEDTVARIEQQRLHAQASGIAGQLDARLQARNLGAIRDLKQVVTILEDVLTQESFAILGPGGQVLFANRDQLKGRTLPLRQYVLSADRTGPLARRLQDVPGFVYALIAIAPIDTPLPALKGSTVVMFRSREQVEALSRQINHRVTLVVLALVVGALLIAGWLSRDLVVRLRAAGEAARAVAQGDLTRRVPEKGADEITDLSRHFNHMTERIEALVAGLRRSEQARRDLLMMVGHDLRTPMTSIAGFAEALRDGVVQGEERRQRTYEIIAAESARLNRFVNDLFDMAKLEAGQLEIRLQAIVVGPWLSEFAEGFRPVAEQAGTRLDLEVSPEAGQARIYGDRERLDQVLSNLAGNAVRYSPPGEAVVLRARTEGEDLVLEVADRGPGLSPEEAERVFERFYQGSASGQGHQGAGLGLAIIKSLVEAHGGSTGVTSTPSQGATFWVRLERIAPGE